MTALNVDELSRIPMSPFLLATLKRAAEYATAQAHREVTLEHLLLAIAEDPEASVVLKSSNIDMLRLMSDVSGYLGRLEDRQDPANLQPVMISQDLRKVLEAAAAAASHGRRREINGAIVLAAIVGDGRSVAAQMLRSQGLTFEEAIKALQRAVAPPQQQPQPAPVQAAPTPQALPAPALSAAPTPMSLPPGPAPHPTAGPGATAESILASARERVQSRSIQGTPDQLAPAPPLQVDPSRPQVAEPSGPGAGPGRDRIEPQFEIVLRTQPPPAQPPVSPPQPDGQPTPGLSGPAPSLPRPAGPFGAPPPAGSPPPAGAPPWAQPWPAPAPPPGHGGMPNARQVPQAAPMPASFPAPGPIAAPPPQRPVNVGAAQRPQAGAQAPWADGAGPRRRGGPAQGPGMRVDAGQLVENIPRRLRVGVPVVAEARVARADVRAIVEGLQGGGAVYRHEVMVTKAMSVRLRAPNGGFFIETASPETQWLENVLGVMPDDFASWRWTITPQSRGKKRLQLVVSARTVGADGIAAETALPDQTIDVKVSINYGRTLLRLAGWVVAAAAGGLVARFGERGYEIMMRLMG